MNLGFARAGFERFLRDLLETINAPGAEQQLGAFRAERRGPARSKTGRGAGDQHPFVFQS